MNAEQAKQRYQEASQLFGEGHVAQARAILEELAEAYPDNTQVRAALSKCQTPEPTHNKTKSHWLIAVAGVAVLVMVAGAVYWAGSHKTSDTKEPDKLFATTDVPAATQLAATTESASSAAPSQLDEATARGTSWRPEKGAVAELMAKHGPPQSWPGEWPAFPLERKTIPNRDYPDGKCDIWVPTEEVRQAYLKQSFHATPYKGRTATEADVKKDLTQYGYYYSEYPPAYVPDLDYTEYNEEPIYPFVGQMVPGTNIQYTQPPTPAVWLIDLTPDGKTIPALTTIDPRKFRSINWPRERYMEAVERARSGNADATLSGYQKTTTLNVSGVVRISGDYGVWEYQTLTTQPGTVMVIDANSDDSAIDLSTGEGLTTRRVEFIVANHGTLATDGTSQRPVIWTSNALSPQSENLSKMNMDCEWGILEYWPGSASPSGRVAYNIVEHAYANLAIESDQVECVEDNVFRYSTKSYDGIAKHNEWEGKALVSSKPVIVRHNEFATNYNSIQQFGSGMRVERNLMYNNFNRYRDDVGKYLLGGRGVFCAEDTVTVAENNTIWKCTWGVAAEVYSTNKKRISGNILAGNDAGVSLYNLSLTTIPVISENYFFANRNHVWGAYTKGKTGEVVFTAKDLPPNTWDADPLFRNVRVYDLFSLKIDNAACGPR